MKKRRLGECFLPDAITNRVAERKSEQDKLDNVFKTMNSVDIVGLREKNLVISEDHALLLLSSRLTFLGVVTLKFCLEHVPKTYSAVQRDTGAPIRFTFMADIMRKKGFMLSPLEVQQYVLMLEVYCPNFLSSVLDFTDALWMLTEESSYRYNKFIAPPVETCLKCENALSMHNLPSKAVVYGATGPLPASKITLECRRCKINYGVGNFADDSGHHLYPKNMESLLIEGSNVTYMDRRLYKWIPSLG